MSSNASLNIPRFAHAKNAHRIATGFPPIPRSSILCNNRSAGFAFARH
jgi:hypothetical protein